MRLIPACRHMTLSLIMAAARSYALSILNQAPWMFTGYENIPCSQEGKFKSSMFYEINMN